MRIRQPATGGSSRLTVPQRRNRTSPLADPISAASSPTRSRADGSRFGSRRGRSRSARWPRSSSRDASARVEAGVAGAPLELLDLERVRSSAAALLGPGPDDRTLTVTFVRDAPGGEANASCGAVAAHAPICDGAKARAERCSGPRSRGSPGSAGCGLLLTEIRVGRRMLRLGLRASIRTTRARCVPDYATTALPRSGKPSPWAARVAAVGRALHLHADPLVVDGDDEPSFVRARNEA